MPDRRARLLARVCLALACVIAGRCAEERPAILVQDTSISVENQGREAWSNLEIWLNDHYRVTARTLEPGGRLIVPLDAFVAGYGQRFDRRRQTPFGIEVTAREASGREARLVWGKGRRR
jgi:hypothetical protein